MRAPSEYGAVNSVLLKTVEVIKLKCEKLPQTEGPKKCDDEMECAVLDKVLDIREKLAKSEYNVAVCL